MRGHIDAFFRATSRWRLTVSEQRALLGSPTDERWLRVTRDAVPSVTPGEFARVSAVLQIDKALSHCLTDPHEAARWLRTLEMASPFFGRTPLALLFRGMDSVKAVADYLEARSPFSRMRLSR